MPPSPSRRIPAVGSIAVLIGLLTLAGCQEDEITHGVVPRAAEPVKTRLIGVIYPNPHGDRTWFFKLMGPANAFDGLADPFDAFMHSVRFTDKADPPMTWTLPDGWTKTDAPPGVDFAFHLGERPVKFTITGMPRNPDRDAELLANVNRWRTKQLGLPAVDKAGLQDLRKDDNNKQIQDMNINGDPVTLVDMTGTGGGAGPIVAAAKAPEGPGWTYQKPDGWDADPHPEAGFVPAEAIFTIDQDGKTAKVTVTALPGPGGDLGANINRWAKQIEAPAVGDDDLKKIPKITVGGRESPYVDLKGDKGRTLGVIVPVGNRTWFFKMSGPAELVEKQKNKFDDFLKYVEFSGDKGGEQ